MKNILEYNKWETDITMPEIGGVDFNIENKKPQFKIGDKVNIPKTKHIGVDKGQPENNRLVKKARENGQDFLFLNGIKNNIYYLGYRYTPDFWEASFSVNDLEHYTPRNNQTIDSIIQDYTKDTLKVENVKNYNKFTNK